MEMGLFDNEIIFQKDYNTVYTAGFITVDYLKRFGDYNITEAYVGGACGNIAMNLSYWGINSFPISRIDISRYGDDIINDLKNSGIDCKYVFRDNDGVTPTITQYNIKDNGKLLQEFGTFDSLGIYGRYTSITKKQVIEIIKNIDTNAIIPFICVFDRADVSYLMLASELKRLGVIIWYEPNTSKSNQLESMNRMASISDIIKFSEHKISKDVINKFIRDENKIVIQTLGSGGANFRFNKEWCHINSNTPLMPIIDCVGAGDFMTSAIIFQMSRKKIDNVANMTLNEFKNILSNAMRGAADNCCYEGSRGRMRYNQRKCS